MGVFRGRRVNAGQSDVVTARAELHRPALPMAAALTAAAAAVFGFAAIFCLLSHTQTLCCHSNQKQRSERCRGVLGLVFYTIAETVYFYCALVPWLSTAAPALKELVLLINQPCLILVFVTMYLVVWSDPGLVRELPPDSRGGAD